MKLTKTKTTIHDIARELNIDSSTVSRALNNNTRVSKKTKEKINAKAEELGYQRNQLASNLRTNKTNTVGVIVPRISRHFFSSCISGIEEVAYENGFNVIICQSLDQFEREQKIVNTLSGNRVDGVLISISMETKEINHLEIFKKNKTPLVFFDRHHSIHGNSNVLIDDFQGGFEATEHLIHQGCKNIAHFSGPQEILIYKNRFEGYKAALIKNSLPFNEELVITSKLTEVDGVKNIKKLLQINPIIDGIFSSNDVASISAIQYLKTLGFKIPQDVAFVGFSNEPISSVIEPSLTTIEQPGFEMGKIAAKLLIDQIFSKETPLAETTILKPLLITRNSSLKLKI
jgi:LacI family transcriptional regulator